MWKEEPPHPDPPRRERETQHATHHLWFPLENGSLKGRYYNIFSYIYGPILDKYYAPRHYFTNSTGSMNEQKLIFSALREIMKP
ncbi:MAG: hypothetical protein ABII90_04605 [Bacteroidota bacterium]